MNKFITNPTVEDRHGPKFYNTAILNSIPEESLPFYYTTNEGDRLDTLANKFYNNTSYWWIIAKANNLANGTIALPVATRLFIPNI